MRILSMTATFGKLEHETLTLQPGLNVITAPNEWGKSTWCAFLLAMLYGIDTRAKSTKTLLADKEKYVPWSGTPMSGSIRLIWQDRDITIQRHTRGRVPMGEFRAFETDSGLAVEELTGDNCGQVLLGVDKNVFLRAGFIRFTDLSECQDDALRRRLNGLVTTGDESNCADLLAQKLKELKNRCRYHRSGLLPQALEERQALQERMADSSSRSRQLEKLLKRKRELEVHMQTLENHKLALLYADAQGDEEKVQAARDTKDRAVETVEALEEQSRQMPSRQKAEEKLMALNRLRDTWEAIQMEERMLPKLPQPPEAPLAFRECDTRQALEQAKAHRDEVQSLTPGRNILAPLLVFTGIVLFCAGAAAVFFRLLLPAILLGVAGLGISVTGAILWRQHRKKMTRMLRRKAALARHYGAPDPDSWVMLAEKYAADRQDFDRRNDACRRLRGDLDERKEQMLLTVTGLAQGKGLMEALRYWREVLDFWDAYADAFRDRQQAESHLKALSSMARTSQAPTQPDTLTCSLEETNAMFLSAGQELKQLHQLLGQCQGQADALGDDSDLPRELEALNRRIAKLELTCRALELAQDALDRASAELQRRFAPQITEHTRQIFTRLTGGKYPRLNLAYDLSLHAGAVDEDVLHSHLWRSDGTVDQLYFALRLAVARELTPTAPVILDDALIRFDDTRLAAALAILEEEANSRQVILFTCQSREQNIPH